MNSVRPQQLLVKITLELAFALKKPLIIVMIAMFLLVPVILVLENCVSMTLAESARLLSGALGETIVLIQPLKNLLVSLIAKEDLIVVDLILNLLVSSVAIYRGLARAVAKAANWPEVHWTVL